MNLRVLFFSLTILSISFSNALAKVAPVYKLEERPSQNIELSEDHVIKNADQAVSVLMSELDELSGAETSLLLVHFISSPLGDHYTFDQTYKGVRIWQSSIRLHVNKEGNPFLAQSTLIKVDAIKVSSENLGTNRLVPLRDGYEWGNYEVVDNLQGVPFEQLWINNVIVWRREGRLNFRQKDTTVFGYVYLPNPVYSAEMDYGVPYVDSADADTKVLRDERKLVQFTARVVNDTFILENNWLRFKDFNNPVTERTFSMNDSFLFNRSESGFEDVNTFFHVNNMADRARALGFSNLIFNLIHIDAHGQAGQDNSSFNYSSNPVSLEFGTGGVDDAEDGQVIVHEFSHSMSHKASPFTFDGSERRAMEEGNADYFSVSYSRQYNDYNWQKVFSWDGHNEFWEGFTAKAAKNYKTDLKGIMNEDREIWSSALAEILDILGRDVTDSLVFSHLYLQAKNTSMPQMANAMLDVEDILWGGKYYEEVKGTFVKYGILEWSVSLPDDKIIDGIVSVKNASSWSKGEGDLIIEVQSKDVKEVNLYNVSGQLMYSMKIDESGSYFIPSYICGSGIYFLQISTTSNSDITKLLHY